MKEDILAMGVGALIFILMINIAAFLISIEGCGCGKKIEYIMPGTLIGCWAMEKK